MAIFNKALLGNVCGSMVLSVILYGEGRWIKNMRACGGGGGVGFQTNTSSHMELVFGSSSEQVETLSLVSSTLPWMMGPALSSGMILGVGINIYGCNFLNYFIRLVFQRLRWRIT